MAPPGALARALLCVCVGAALIATDAWRLEASVLPVEWTHHGRAHADAQAEFRLLLAQRNRDALLRWATNISSPGHPQYAQYASREEVLALIAPAAHERARVVTWLGAHGLETTRDLGDALVVLGRAADVEKAFGTELHVFSDALRGTAQFLRAPGGLELPAEWAGLVVGATGLVDMTRRRRLGSLPAARGGSDPSDKVVIPLTLYNQYAVPTGLAVESNSSQCVVEFGTDLYYTPGDLVAFCAGAGVATPRPVQHVGPVKSGNDPDGESTLDIQMVVSVGRNASNVFWTLDGWVLDFAQDLFAADAPPLVNSQSWSTDERAQGADYGDRLDAEYQKLALRGVTMLAASGDDGAVGTGSCSGNEYPLNPGSPAASVFVLSVGATMLVQADGADVDADADALPPVCSQPGITCAVSGVEAPADVPSIGYATGGGFSVWNAVPDYQAAVVAAYVQNASIPKPPSGWDGSHRGFPDVSALGQNIQIYQQGGWALSGGTSAATPIVAGVIALLNDRLLRSGKAPVGFVNPLFYEMARSAPATFRKIGNLSTNNKGGCKLGFVSAESGWDPVTGLGTPNVTAMLEFIDAHLDWFADA